MNENLFQMVGNQTRAHLIVCLSHGESTVTVLHARCKLSQSALSQHLAKLRSSGCVKARRDGQKIYYRLTDKRVGSLCKRLIELATDVKCVRE